MAKRPNLTDITNILNSGTTINNNWDEIGSAFDNTLSRDGSTPNQMLSDLDMNSNDILNARDVDVQRNLTVQGVDISDILAGVGPGTVFNTTNRFSGDGSTLTFVLTKDPVSRANTQVYIDGIYQQKDTYTVSGTSLSFTTAPPKGVDNVEINIQESTSTGTPSANGVSTSDGEDVQAKLDQSHYTSRTDFVSDIVAGKKWDDGNVVSDGTVSYIKSAGATAISDMLGWLPFGDVYLEHFGASGDGSDDSSAWTQALAYQQAFGDTINLREGRTYAHSGLTMHTGLAISGGPSSRPVIKMLDATNGNVMAGTDITDVTLRDIIVDGNQANQTVGSSNNARAVYFLGACHRLRGENVLIRNAVDHGLFLSNGGVEANECGRDSTFVDCRAENCGSAAHQAAGGAGGTGFVGGHDSLKWVSCHATGNDLNGFKSGGRHIGCISYNNGQGNGGSGFETGFSASTAKHATFVACEARGNDGDGWRNLGEIDDLIFQGCVSEENGAAGILLGQALLRATIQGCVLRNNGQDGTITPGGITGNGGIHIGGTSVDPEYISISGCQFYDDQGLPTQENHIRVDEYGDFIQIADDNMFGPSAGEAIVFDNTLANNSRVGRCYGLKTTVDDLAPSSVTGTVTITLLKQLIIPAGYLPASQRIKFSAVGFCSGTAGTKQVRYEVNTGAGGISNIVINQAAGDENRFIITGEIYRTSGTTVVVDVNGKEVGGPNDDVADTTSISFASDLYISIYGTLGNAADTITIDRWQVQPT